VENAEKKINLKNVQITDITADLR